MLGYLRSWRIRRTVGNSLRVGHLFVAALDDLHPSLVSRNLRPHRRLLIKDYRCQTNSSTASFATFHLQLFPVKIIHFKCHFIRFFFFYFTTLPMSCVQIIEDPFASVCKWVLFITSSSVLIDLICEVQIPMESTCCL